MPTTYFEMYHKSDELIVRLEQSFSSLAVLKFWACNCCEGFFVVVMLAFVLGGSPTLWMWDDV